MPKIGKGTKKVQATRIIQGLVKHFDKGRIYPVGGRRYTPKQLIDAFQAHIDAIERVDAAQAAVTAAVARERQIALRVRELARQLKQTVTVELGFSIAGWSDFGWEVPKPPGPKKLDAKLQGAKKARATREMRHTMGKRQKKKIRGR